MPEDVKQSSHHLLGNAYLLEVGAAISRFSDATFTLTEVARGAEVEKNCAGTALAKLEKAGVIKRLPKVGREQPYERIPSSYWHLCSALLDELRP